VKSGHLLAAVKTEFGKFGDALSAVKEKIDQASRKMEDVDVRSRVITRRLRDVEELPSNPQPMLRNCCQARMTTAGLIKGYRIAAHEDGIDHGSE